MRTTLPGEPPIEMQVRHAPRARRISLRVSGRDGRVTLTVPPGATMSEAIGFARDRETWLRRAIAEIPAPQRPGPGGSIAIEGQRHAVVAASVRRARLFDGDLLVPKGGAAGPAIATFLKTLARERGQASVARHAAAIRRPVARLTLRDTRSRWGSCTAEGRLMLSWRLVMAPPEVLDYVAAHEVAHLVHLDHSSRFWDLTATLCPDWKTCRLWLRKHGATLQALDFT